MTDYHSGVAGGGGLLSNPFQLVATVRVRYLEDDGGERSIPLQSLWGGNASLGAAPQLLHSLADHAPEPVRHQGGREVASVQRLRGVQGWDGAFAYTRGKRRETYSNTKMRE